MEVLKSFRAYVEKMREEGELTEVRQERSEERRVGKECRL